MTTSDIRDTVRAPRPRWLIVAVAVATAAFIAGGVSPGQRGRCRPEPILEHHHVDVRRLRLSRNG